MTYPTGEGGADWALCNDCETNLDLDGTIKGALLDCLKTATAMLEDYNADKLTLDGFYAVMKEVTGQ